mmetsp:Transcript_65965/g.97688  ORF Transcript_65965/g.97688 Transcript_65965/m.97688 type:complete len:348 (-) Transcript_65965:573-1616(-)
MLSSTTSPTNRSKSSSSTSPPKPTAPSSAPNISTGSTPSDASRLAIPSGNSTAENNYHYRRQTSRTTATPSTPSYNYNTTPSSSSTSYYNYNNHHHLSSHMSPQAYLTRLLDVQQMDIQSALDQMKTLCSTSPSRAYKTSYYRKQTKDHWARDDPAFFALQVVFLVCTSIAYVIAFRVEGRGFVSGVLDFLVKSVGVHYIGWGVIMATVGRLISNDYLTVVGGTGGGSSSAGIGGSGGREIHVKQKVEWLYAFDIHCNAFFPHVRTFICTPILSFTIRTRQIIICNGISKYIVWYSIFLVFLYYSFRISRYVFLILGKLSYVVLDLLYSVFNTPPTLLPLHIHKHAQ